jgi:hypothetical protein
MADCQSGKGGYVIVGKPESNNRCLFPVTNRNNAPSPSASWLPLLHPPIYEPTFLSCWICRTGGPANLQLRLLEGLNIGHRKSVTDGRIGSVLRQLESWKSVDQTIANGPEVLLNATRSSSTMSAPRYSHGNLLRLYNRISGFHRALWPYPVPGVGRREGVILVFRGLTIGKN